MKLSVNLDKIGSIGLFLTALTCPACFPLFGFVLTSFGLGSFELFGEKTIWVFEGFMLLSVIGNYFSYKIHRNILPLLLALASVLLIIYAYKFYNGNNWQSLFYIAMFTLIAASVMNYFLIKKAKAVCKSCVVVDGKTVELNSTITCPHCGYSKTETMPTNACQFFYQCENCKTILRPKPGDCCVYCSYGNVKCPSKQ
jgi:predicted ferric reductase